MAVRVGMGKVVSLYRGRDPRELPMYGIGDAAVYLGMPRSTVVTWVRGQRVQPRSGSTGSGSPSHFGLLIRSASTSDCRR